MIPMMMATMHGPRAVRGTQRQRTFMLRKTIGFAIVASGFAVIVAQALQPMVGG
ncbi:conserved exported hypothetical protein [Paraburkholderia ribeironis]|uniref:Uncharacterized protein n=1 Tax=Paraburkholderia ribeironis TaxID=1247936 RepID=A0A1N7S5P8_9BURK|nr:hypothetical protein [Paraburkholderia ribeironis]SIT42636.1 conserved exported hypothetical protein [Paraburkholderia ribeironis]